MKTIPVRFWIDSDALDVAAYCLCIVTALEKGISYVVVRQLM